MHFNLQFYFEFVKTLTCKRELQERKKAFEKPLNTFYLWLHGLVLMYIINDHTGNMNKKPATAYMSNGQFFFIWNK